MAAVALDHAEYGPAQGPAAVLLHGFPLDRSMWSPVAAALARAGFRVIVPDLRGHGRSPVPEAGPTMELMADDVVALVDRLGVSTFLLGGFSMGGYVALQCTAQAGERIRGLWLCDTRADPDTDEARKGRAETIDAVRRQGMSVLVDRMMPKFFTEATRTSRPDIVEDVRRVILANPVAGAMGALQAMAQRPDQRPLLARIGVPTLVTVGEADALTPPDASRAMAQAIPKARLEVIPGAAHLMPLETAELLNDVLVKWALPLKAATPTA